MLLCPSPIIIMFIFAILAVPEISWPYIVSSFKNLLFFGVWLHLFLICLNASIRNPPVLHAGSYTLSPHFGSTKSPTNFTICLGVKYSPKSVQILTAYFRKCANASPLTSESASSSWKTDGWSTVVRRLAGLFISKCHWNTSLRGLY